MDGHTHTHTPPPPGHLQAPLYPSTAQIELLRVVIARSPGRGSAGLKAQAGIFGSGLWHQVPAQAAVPAQGCGAPLWVQWELQHAQSIAGHSPANARCPSLTCTLFLEDIPVLGWQCQASSARSCPWLLSWLAQQSSANGIFGSHVPRLALVVLRKEHGRPG